MPTNTLTQAQAEAKADHDFAAWDVASYAWMRDHYNHAAADAYATRIDELKRDKQMIRTNMIPDPATKEARDDGCTCRCEPTYHPSPGRMVTDVPEPVTDPRCPLHGRYDPDAG